MSKLLGNTRELFVKAMEGVSDAAAKLASNAKYKVTEVNLTTRRREILENFGKKCYDLWNQGTQFPPEVEAELAELADIDEQINTLKAEHFSYLNPELEKELQEKQSENESESEVDEIIFNEEVDEKILENSNEEIIEEIVNETDDNQK
ncbi:MAG: hypothetical protein GYA87_04120 [Christensenellaceae bacterium]|nr:hypothetical protein [Christensenellaceae bacterium]